MQGLQVFLARHGWLFHSTVASSAVQELGSPRSSHLSAFGVPSVKLLLLLGARLKGGPRPPRVRVLLRVACRGRCAVIQLQNATWPYLVVDLSGEACLSL